MTWLHVVVLCLWGLMAGLLVSVGNRGGVVGTQSIIALVVFGRFSEPADQALGLATLVLTGGLAQVAFLSVVRWPLPLRNQRAATAAAYRALSSLAAASDEASTLPAAEAIDEAEASLASPTLFGDAAVTTLRSLVNEAYRLRVQIMAIHALLRQLRAAGARRASAHPRARCDAPSRSPRPRWTPPRWPSRATRTRSIGCCGAAPSSTPRSQAYGGGRPGVAGAAHGPPARRPGGAGPRRRRPVTGRRQGRRAAHPAAVPAHEPSAAAACAPTSSRCGPTCRSTPRRAATRCGWP